MKDFIIEHPDGLATYRLYEKDSKSMAKRNKQKPSSSSSTSAPTSNGNKKKEKDSVDIKSGESIDMAGGPSQQMMMWRKFVDLCQSLDRNGGWGTSLSSSSSSGGRTRSHGNHDIPDPNRPNHHNDRDVIDGTAECRELANVALQTKRILSALVKSGQSSSMEEVVIDDIEYE